MLIFFIEFKFLALTFLKKKQKKHLSGCPLMALVENLFTRKQLLLEERRKQFLSVLRKLAECWMQQVYSDNHHMVKTLS